MLGFSTKEQAREMSDEDILRRSRGEPWVFAVLLDRYQAAFLRKATSIVWRQEDAEEVVQDAFTKIYLNAGRFEPQPGASFSSWAYRILMNTAFTRYQKLIKEGQRFSRIDPEFESFLKDENPFSQVTEDQDKVERILASMPAHLAAVLRMFYLERWSQQDIANESGEDVGTIKARIHRAKAVFRKVATGKI
jgi:RNA polymerase sigma-70 factor (ECF subfamily)